MSRNEVLARAYWVTEPGRGELRTEPLPPLAAGAVRVRTLYTAVSRGTESLVFQGAVPESEHARMRCPFQAGDFPGPVKYGYSNVGVVVGGPAGLRGQQVFCLYPHQNHYQVPADAVHPLPDGVPAERAVLAANMETAVNGLWDAAPRLGDRITVIGGGTLGCLLARLVARVPGCSVELIDIDESRAEIARRLGVRFATPTAATRDADLVVHTSGAPDGLVQALDIAAFEATILEMSWYGDRAVALPLGQGFHSRRLTLRSSQVATIAGAQRARWDHRRRMALALTLLRDPALDALITGEDPFDDLPDVQARLANAPAATICHRIRYP
jgi:threonine dehydrogenase-like Zn-dependent dehydrogenase